MKKIKGKFGKVILKPSVILKTLTKIEKEIILNSDLLHLLSKVMWEQYGFFINLIFITTFF